MADSKPSEKKLSPGAEKAVAEFSKSCDLRMAAHNASGMPAGPLYHYTSEQAFYSILESEQFWFCSIYHMDDDVELNYGFEISRSLLREKAAAGDMYTRMFCEELVGDDEVQKIRSVFEFYSVSFGARDDTEQWKDYGDTERGVSFGMSPEFFHLAPFADPANPKPEEKIFFSKVAYGDEAARARHAPVIDGAIATLQKTIASGEIRDGHDAQLFFQHVATNMYVELLWNCVTTKNEKWSHQDETRLLALNYLKAPQLEIKNAVKKPRVELPQPLLKKCLVEVLVGPKADKDAKERIRQFLQKRGLGHVKVGRATS